MIVNRRTASRKQAGYVQRISDNPPAFDIVVNTEQKLASAYATLVHEIAHVYCGHLGGHPRRVWPDRAGLAHDAREFEAESVSFIVCARLGLANANQYLAGHLDGHTSIPDIEINRVILVAGRIEEMGKQVKRKKKEVPQ